jgi:hypothetical protein
MERNIKITVKNYENHPDLCIGLNITTQKGETLEEKRKEEEERKRREDEEEERKREEEKKKKEEEEKKKEEERKKEENKFIYPLKIIKETIINKDLILKVDCCEIKNEKNLFKSLLVKKNNTVEDIIMNLLEKLKMNYEKGVYYFKNSDSEDYLYGNDLMMNFEILNTKFKNNSPILLVLSKFYLINQKIKF